MMSGHDDPIGFMIKTATYFIGAFFGALFVIVAAIWFPIGWWAFVPLVIGAVVGRLMFYRLFGE